MRKWITVVMLALLATALFLGGMSAAAQDACNDLVVDEANVFGKDFARVEAAANDLVNLGADVRVRTIQTFAPAGNLDQFAKQLEQQCPSWRAADGGTKNNLVVVIVAVKDRKNGIYYGSQWKGSLDPQWNRIQANAMNPQFRNGDFAAGIVNGLGEIQKVVYQQLNPPPPIVVVQPTPQQSAPPDLSGLWNALLWLVIFSGMGIAAFFGFRGISVYLARKEKERAAQQKARLAKQAAASRIQELSETLPMLEVSVNAIAKKVSSEDAKPLQDGFAKIQALYTNATQQYSDCGHSAGDPDRPGLSEAEYLAIADAYAEPRDSLRDADSIKKELDEKITWLEAAVTETPKKLEETKVEVARATERVSGVTAQGFKTEQPEKILTQAATSLDKAAALLEKKSFAKATKAIEAAGAHAEEAVSLAEGFPVQKRSCDAAGAQLAARIEGVKEVILAGRSVFEKISTRYAESSWESVRGNGTEATKRVSASSDALERMREASAMDTQNWDEANTYVSRATSLLDEAESFMRSITALEGHLAQAQRDAPNEVKAAAADIATAQEYIRQYDEDIKESLETDLRKAGKQLEEAETELAKEKPDYLKVTKRARDVHATADAILAEAREEHETAERTRAKAKSALRDANAAVSRTREYLEDHQGDVKRRNLGSAEDFLERATNAVVLAQIIEYAERAESEADQVYSKARSDVDRAEEAQRQAYYAQQQRESSSSSSSFGSSSSGGSSDWGSSSSGGGSSGFGSSGGGGGGSSGW